MSGQLLNFVHIPKTAGTTFISILKKNFRPEDILQIDGLDPDRTFEFVKDLPGVENNYKIIMGHWSLKFEPLFKSREIVRIVFLRNPVDLVISSYYYIRKTPKHKQHTLVNELTLSEFIAMRKEMNLDNIQTRHLACIATNMVGSDIDFSQYGLQYLEIARQELARSTYVFLTEKFDESLQILKGDKILRSISYKRKNVSVQDKSQLNIPESVIKQIQDDNKFDLELYAEAKKINSLLSVNHPSSRNENFIRWMLKRLK